MSDLSAEDFRIDLNRKIEETREFSAENLKLSVESLKFGAEQNKLVAEALKLAAEQAKLAAEQAKLAAEQFKLERDRRLAPWQLGFLILGSLVSLGGLIAGINAIRQLLTAQGTP